MLQIQPQESSLLRQRAVGPSLPSLTAVLLAFFACSSGRCCTGLVLSTALTSAQRRGSKGCLSLLGSGACGKCRSDISTALQGGRESPVYDQQCRRGAFVGRSGGLVFSRGLKIRSVLHIFFVSSRFSFLTSMSLQDLFAVLAISDVSFTALVALPGACG